MSTEFPWWTTTLGATAIVAAGAALGDTWFPWAIVVGCVAAAVFAERTAFFTVLAQPPLITAAVGATAVLLGKPLLNAVFVLSNTFPYLVATMLVAAAVVAVRARRAT